MPIDGGARTRACLKLSGVICFLTGVIVATLPSASDAIAGGCPATHDYAMTCRSLAEQGDAEAQFDLGFLYEQGKDYAEAVTWYRKSAEQGYRVAQVLLGDMYNFGRHVPQDAAEAAKWYSKAAEQGATNVQFDLGFLYEQGKGVPQNYAEAETWYRESAEDGDPHGQFGLGRLYADGNGVPQDYVLAHMWFNLAAAQGLEDAKSARDKLVRHRPRAADPPWMKTADPLHPSAQTNPIFSLERSRQVSIQDDPRTDRRGAAAGAGVEADEVVRQYAARYPEGPG